jgi:hypothetical protein
MGSSELALLLSFWLVFSELSVTVLVDAAGLFPASIIVLNHSQPEAFFEAVTGPPDVLHIPNHITQR